MAAKHLILCAEIIINSTNNTLHFSENGTSRSAVIPEGLYFLYGDGSESGTADDGASNGDLCAVIKTAMNTAAGSTTYDVNTYFWKDKDHLTTSVVILADSGNLQIFDHGTFDIGVIGFSTSSGIGPSVSSDISSPYCWMANQPYVSVLLLEHSTDHSQHFTASGKPYSYSLRDSHIKLNVPFKNVAKRRVISYDDDTFVTDSFENFWKYCSSGQYLRLYIKENSGVAYNVSNSDLHMQCVLDLDANGSFKPQQVAHSTSLYNFDLTLREVKSL